MLLEDFLKIMKENRNTIAYVYGDEKYTYKDFYKFVCNIYNFLLKENIKNKKVVVYGKKEAYMKASFLACSYAGIAYIPIDRNTPKERIDYILKTAEPDLIIGDLNYNRCKTINSKQITQIMNQINYEEIRNIYLKPNDIYYIIFTSGSTGTPKGVAVSYENVDSCIKWLKKITEAKNDIILNQANFSFDLSVADLYLSMATESTHFILKDIEKFDYKNIFTLLKNSNATIAVFTPTFADLLLLDKSFSNSLMPNLRKIIFCGEKLNKKTVLKLRERFNDITIINCYGPTECTFAVTSYIINKNIPLEDEIPIGKPKEDANIYIVDENKKALKEGEIGEILITGKSVAIGYLKKENNRFITFNDERGYLTGDLGYVKNGIIYFKGRNDKQIKYKGYRIELLDIEENLQKLNYVEKAIVLPKKNNEGKVIAIIAFVKTSKNVEPNIIKEELKSMLPLYMIPKIKLIDDFPINKNGKCDEKKLLEETI